MRKKLNGTVIVTYRCNGRCHMCSRYKEPSQPQEELTVETVRKLPPMYFTNITGGEPFLRDDLPQIVRELDRISDRIVISTNGFYTERIVQLCREFPHVGIRVSIEGTEQTNNALRGIPDGYRRGLETLKALREMGIKDIGFGMTLQDCNACDLLALYELSEAWNMEFATAAVHNSFYFVKKDNAIREKEQVTRQLERLIHKLLRAKHPKKWFRAYFNHGLIHYIHGNPRRLPCRMGFDTFFIDPYGDVMPCNGTEEKEVMGNLNRQSWEQLWRSEAAENVRAKVRRCRRNCWMIGSASPAMKRYFPVCAAWVLWHKLKSLFTERPYGFAEQAKEKGSGL